MNELQKMFEMQERLQNKLGNAPTPNHGLNIDYIKDMSLAAIDEILEALHETPWKPWKQNQKYNEEKFQNEIVDLWHFAINLTLASGMNYKELFKKFNEKNKVNNERKKQGY